MLAFSYTRLALNNSLSCTTSYVPSPRTSSDNSKVSQKPPKHHAPNHESALTDKILKPERTQSLGTIIAAQLGSLTDLKTYVAAAEQGIHSGGGAGGVVWLATDALGCLGVFATYGASTLLVAERRHALTPDVIELGSIYEASMISPVIVTVLAIGFVEHPRAVDESTHICTAPRKCVVRPDASCSEPGSSIWLV